MPLKPPQVGYRFRRIAPMLSAATVMLGALAATGMPLASSAPGQPAGDVGASLPAIDWVRLHGGSGDDPAYGMSAGPDGSVYLTGVTDSPLIGGQPGQGGQDIVLVKYYKSGQRAWTRVLGGPGDEAAQDVAVDGQGNAYTVGYTFSELLGGQRNSGGFDVVVAKYTASGELRWVRLLGGRNGETSDGVAIAADGALLVAGHTASPTMAGLRGSGEGDAFLFKLTPGGEIVWLRRFGGEGQTFARSIVPTPDGSVYVGGETYTKFFYGQRKKHGADAFVLKLAASGEVLWARLSGEDGDDEFRNLALSSDGAVYAAGTTDTMAPFCVPGEGCTVLPINPDILVEKYTPDGALSWRRLLRGRKLELGYGIGVTAEGFVLVAGSTESRVLQGESGGRWRSFVVAAYDATGNRLWIQLWPRGEGNAVARSSDGATYVSGWSYADAVRDQVSAGGWDMLLFRFR